MVSDARIAQGLSHMREREHFGSQERKQLIRLCVCETVGQILAHFAVDGCICSGLDCFAKFDVQALSFAAGEYMYLNWQALV